MKLNDAMIRAFKPSKIIQKIPDGQGLYLFIMPNGSKYWRYLYRFGGKQQTLSMGIYPKISLKEARAKHQDLKKIRDNDIDPSAKRKEAKIKQALALKNNFESVAREWFDTYRGKWGRSHAERIIRRLERDVFPFIGDKSIDALEPPELLSTVRRIVDRGAIETAHRALSECRQVFIYGVGAGYCKSNPVRDLKGLLPPAETVNFPSITEPHKIGELLRAMDAFKGTFTVQCALKLAPLVFVRPSELRKAKWADINLDSGVWRYFVTKTKTWHIVPLSTQALAILRDVHQVTSNSEYVFTVNDPKKPMSEATINAALRRMGYDTKTEITGHGFRAMARTVLAEVQEFDPQIIEHQLAHKVPDSLGTAYNRTKFLVHREALMQVWADYLEELKEGDKKAKIRTA